MVFCIPLVASLYIMIVDQTTASSEWATPNTTNYTPNIATSEDLSTNLLLSQKIKPLNYQVFLSVWCICILLLFLLPVASTSMVGRSEPLCAMCSSSKRTDICFQRRTSISPISQRPPVTLRVAPFGRGPAVVWRNNVLLHCKHTSNIIINYIL